MFFSLSGILQKANSEEEASNQIFKINQILYCDNYDSFTDSYALSGIFEVDEIEDFGKALQENLTQFVENYKEKNDNVQNN